MSIIQKDRLYNDEMVVQHNFYFLLSTLLFPYVENIRLGFSIFFSVFSDFNLFLSLLHYFYRLVFRYYCKLYCIAMPDAIQHAIAENIGSLVYIYTVA